MKPVRRVVFLESQRGVESLFTRGLRSGAVAAGWETERVALEETAARPRSDKSVRVELLAKRPDAVFFLMDAPLHLEHLWDDPGFGHVDKVSLWFDDFYRSPKTLARPEVWNHWQTNHHVRVGIWDGFWRDRWKALTNAPAFPVQLAADPRLFYPGVPAWDSSWKNRATFVGTIPSLKSLETTAATFPRPLQLLLEATLAALATAPWPLRPYELAQTAQTSLGFKAGLAIDAILQKPELLALWNHLIWRWGKRFARLRGLAAVSKAGPLAILSGHSTESYAGEDELRAALPTGADLVYADTKSVPANNWKNLFQTGKFQVQIMDPQSIEGGLPFRVFEAAACGVPLLSDTRLELQTNFAAQPGLTLAENEAALGDAAATLFGMSATELAERGRKFKSGFARRHTWEVRWNEISRLPETRSISSPCFDGSDRHLDDRLPQAA